MTEKQKVRESFRDAVFKRDKNCCKLCGRSDVKLDAHHITNRKEMPKGGYTIFNGVTLCDHEDGCHLQVEKFYFTEYALEIDTENKLHPNNLYSLIGSSYELAYEHSLKL